MTLSKRLWSGLLAGIVAALAMTIVMILLRQLLGIPTPSEMFGDRMVPTYRADEFLGLLGKLGGYNRAKQIGVLSVLAGQLGVGAIAGVVYSLLATNPRRASRRHPRRPSMAAIIFIVSFVVIFWLATVIFLEPVLNTNFAGLPPSRAYLATTVGLAIAYITYGLFLMLSHRFVVTTESSTLAASRHSRSRRILVLGGVGIVMASAVAYLLARLYRAATFDYDGRQYIGVDVVPITPNDHFYTVTKNIIDPEVDSSKWRLEVTGLVEQPRVYNLEELSGLGGASQETTLMCISNWVGGGLMSNAIWEGLPLADLIKASNPRSGVVEVKFRAVDGYTDTISFEEAIKPTTFLALKMNGEPLPRKHGFPARLIAPGLFGEKSVKWITLIELIDHDGKGFYEQQGWGPNFNVPTRARFDFPYYDQSVPLASPVILKGIAFGGNRGVSRVEVSVDGGSEWRDAKIEYPGTMLSWALWSYDWVPPGAGEYKLVVRATDGSGEVQSAVDRATVPEGATGYHRVTLTLV
jgi:DMSO/TMAO reductase YedYZ molybdopterin-dependent catalytic subunit